MSSELVDKTPPHSTKQALVGTTVSERADLWGHPRQLWMLLAVGACYTFGFVGFRAYLVPYLAQAFFADLGPAAAQRNADLLGSGFFAFMYATPIVGGYVADKILGETRAVALSLWLAAASLVLLAAPTLFRFELGLAGFAMAAGLNIPLTVLIGRNYPGGGARRESGYTLYYLALNLGSFVGPIVCAALVGSHFGYRWGFITAAAGVALGALLFQLRNHKLRPVLPAGNERHGRMEVIIVAVATVALVYPTALLLSRPKVLSVTMYALMALLVVYFIASCIRRRDRVQTQRYLSLLILFVALVLYWTLSLQGFTSLNFFARDHVAAPFDYTLFQAANPLYILIFAPLLALLWPWLDRHGRNPSTPRKFGIGLLGAALSYGLTAGAIRYGTAAGAKVAWEVLAGCYLLQTLGELTLAPIGYSLVVELAAPKEISLAMGSWFFGNGLAYQLAGWVATFTTEEGGAQMGLAGYAHVYWVLFAVGMAAAVVYLLAAPGVTRLMHEEHKSAPRW